MKPRLLQLRFLSVGSFWVYRGSKCVCGTPAPHTMSLALLLLQFLTRMVLLIQKVHSAAHSPAKLHVHPCLYASPSVGIIWTPEVRMREYINYFSPCYDRIPNQELLNGEVDLGPVWGYGPSGKG